MNESAIGRPKRLRVHSWRQFGEIDIALHSQLTVLVGPNGTGKSTLLSLLSLLLHRPDGATDGQIKHDGREFVPVGQCDIGHRDSLFILSIQDDGAEQLVLAERAQGNDDSLGAVPYGTLNGSFHQATKLLFGQRILGSSLKRLLGDLLIPVGGSAGNRSYVISKQLLACGAYPDSSESSLFQSLRRQWEHWAMFSAESTSLLHQRPDRLVLRITQANRDPKLLFQRFASLFLEIAGEACGIQEIRVRDGQLTAVTATGTFSFDAVSHGLALIAMLLWDCVLLDAIFGSALVLIDEPENHLHPGLQRSLMATLVREFPGIQFVVATHSPFFVGAARESSVCLLAFSDYGHVVSRMLNEKDLDRSGTANDVLREALGTTTSRPLWLEEELKARVAKYASREPGREVVSTLHDELKRDGQVALLPDAVRVLKKMQDERAK